MKVLDLLVRIAHFIEALAWMGSSLKRLFYKIFLPRSPRCQPLEWLDWVMLSMVALIVVLVSLLALTKT